MKDDDPVYLCLALRGGQVVTLPFILSRQTASYYIRDWYDGMDEACKDASTLSGQGVFAPKLPVACGPIALNTSGEPNWALVAWDRAQVVAMWMVDASVAAALDRKLCMPAEVGEATRCV